MNLQTLENGSSVCPDDPGEPTTGVRRISVTADEAAFLAELADRRTVMEIGTGLGVSTRAMAARATSVYTVDIDPWVRDNVWLPANVTRGSFADDASLGPFDMIFIDGDHTTLSTVLDLEHASASITQGLIVVHDWKIPEVADALDDTFLRVDTHHGIAIKVV